jgi:hypothetical protein
MHYFRNGSIVSIGETQSFGDKFKKREFILETEEKYPEKIKMEFINDDVDVLDRFIEGEVVTVAFLVKGSEYQGKHFVNIRAIAICEVVDGRVEKEFEKSKKEKDNKRVQDLLDSVKVKK